MAYEKQTWKTGDVITESKLNHMEDGIANSGGSGGGSFVIGVDQETGTLNKTWKEIHDALISGQYVVCISDGDNIVGVSRVEAALTQFSPGSSSAEYVVVLSSYNFMGQHMVFFDCIADSENGYPIMADDEQDEPGDDA